MQPKKKTQRRAEGSFFLLLQTLYTFCSLSIAHRLNKIFKSSAISLTQPSHPLDGHAKQHLVIIFVKWFWDEMMAIDNDEREDIKYKTGLKKKETNKFGATNSILQNRPKDWSVSVY